VTEGQSREAALPLDGRPFDSLTEEEFLTYLHKRTTRYLQELYADHRGAASDIGMQCLFDIARRRRHLGPDTSDEGRYDLGGLEELRGKPGPKESD